MNVKKYNQFTADTNRGPSGFWGDCPWDQIVQGEKDGIVFFDDFLDFGLPGTQTTETNLGRYKVYNTGAGKVITDNMPHSTTAGVKGGIISMLCDTDGDASAIGTQACPILLTTTQNGKFWFEGRIALTSILTNMGQLFFGLGENSIATFGAAIPLANANATDATMAMIGFNRLEDGLAVLNTSYADHAAVWTDILAAANASPLTQLVANTWIKLGMKIDFSQTSRFCTFYVNGQDTGTYMTKAQMLATTYLDVSGLGPCLAFFADSAGTAAYVYLDWWRYAQTY